MKSLDTSFLTLNMCANIAKSKIHVSHSITTICKALQYISYWNVFAFYVRPFSPFQFCIPHSTHVVLYLQRRNWPCNWESASTSWCLARSNFSRPYNIMATPLSPSCFYSFTFMDILSCNVFECNFFNIPICKIPDCILRDTLWSF